VMIVQDLTDLRPLSFEVPPGVRSAERPTYYWCVSPLLSLHPPNHTTTYDTVCRG
jgi:hypothetical protein